MLKHRNKLRVSLVLLFSIIVISWVGLYLYVNKLLEIKIAVLEEDLKKKGYQLTYSHKVFSMNPFDFHLTLQDPTFKDSIGLFEWKAEEVRFGLRIWDTYTLRCSFKGDQTLSILKKSPFPQGVLKFEGTNGLLTLTRDRVLDEVSLDIDRLYSLTEDTKKSLGLQALTLKVNNLSNPIHLHVLFKTNITGVEDKFGSVISLEGDATLSGYQKPTLPKTLEEWRDGGGILDVNVLKVSWPPIVAVANGTLTLDNEMYPLGSFSSRIEGYQEALSTMVDLGWVKSKNASAVGFVLDILGKSDETGKKHLTIPITLQNKKLSIGPASLFKLQPIEGLK